VLSIAVACGLMFEYVHVLDDSMQRPKALQENSLGQKGDAAQERRTP
jgi:hypothetical protein